MSFKSDESIPSEDLMADARRAGREEEFSKINLQIGLQMSLTVADSFPFTFIFLSNG